MRKVTTISMSIPTDLVQRLDASAHGLGISRSSLLTLLINGYFNKKERRE